MMMCDENSMKKSDDIPLLPRRIPCASPTGRRIHSTAQFGIYIVNSSYQLRRIGGEEKDAEQDRQPLCLCDANGAHVYRITDAALSDTRAYYVVTVQQAKIDILITNAFPEMPFKKMVQIVFESKETMRAANLSPIIQLAILQVRKHYKRQSRNSLPRKSISDSNGDGDKGQVAPTGLELLADVVVNGKQ